MVLLSFFILVKVKYSIIVLSQNISKIIRSAIHTPRFDMYRSVDIIRDKECKLANQNFDRMLKSMNQSSSSWPSKLKDIINPKDVSKTSSYPQADQLSALGSSLVCFILFFLAFRILGFWLSPSALQTFQRSHRLKLLRKRCSAKPSNTESPWCQQVQRGPY